MRGIQHVGVDEYIKINNNHFYLGRKCAALDAMLGTVRIIRAIVQKDFLDLVAVGQRSARNVDGQRMLGSGFWTENERLARVMQDSRDLIRTSSSINELHHQNKKKILKYPLFSFLFRYNEIAKYKTDWLRPCWTSPMPLCVCVCEHFPHVPHVLSYPCPSIFSFLFFSLNYFHFPRPFTHGHPH